MHSHLSRNENNCYETFFREIGVDEVGTIFEVCGIDTAK